MDYYIMRLLRLGFSVQDAFRIYDEYKCRQKEEELEMYIEDLEADLYVD